MAALTTSYDGNGILPVRVWEHVKIGLSHNIGKREGDTSKNFLEKVGDTGLWVWEELPGKVYNALSDPRVVVIALTILSQLAISLVFYPYATVNFVRAAVAILPHIPGWAIRFSAYIYISTINVSYGTRALGRVSNQSLMRVFYTTKAAAPAQDRPPATSPHLQDTMSSAGGGGASNQSPDRR